MALRIYWSRSPCYKSLNSFYILYSRHEHNRKKSISISTDALDEFTTELQQNKAAKWVTAIETAKRVQRSDCELISTSPKFNIKELNIIDLDTTFQSALDNHNNKSLMVLIEACIDRIRTPSMAVLLNLLSYFSKSGNCEVLNRIITLYAVVNPEILMKHSNFAHYTAEAVAVNGDTNTAIALFEKVYIENTFLRRRIRLMLKHVIMEVVNNRSEAAIVALLQFTKKLLDKYKDVYPLACMWEACFLSEWYSEQRLAIDILKGRRNLLAAITPKINYTINISLKKLQNDVVLRFLEFLLESNFQAQYSMVIITMFDYNYKRGDLKSCMGIVNWLKEYKIPLTNSLDDKYLDLILKQMQDEHMRIVLDTPVNDFKF